jgi:hypothetical protein
MKILVYDCEIIKAIIPDYKNEAPIEGIEYCKGWDDHENMGISVIGTYNNWNKEQIAFVDTDFYDQGMDYGIIEDLNGNIKSLRQFQRLLDECDVLVGFNNQHFDDKLIKANGFTIPDRVVNYDILVEIWRAVGIQPPFVFPTHAGYSLKQTCEANGLPPKTGDGGNAAIQWQRGEYQKVIDYCLNDIKITTELFRTIINNDGWIANPKNKIKLRGITK